MRLKNNFKQFTLIKQKPQTIHHLYNLHKSQDILYVNVNKPFIASRHKTRRVVTSLQCLLNQPQKKMFLFELLSAQMMRWSSERRPRRAGGAGDAEAALGRGGHVSRNGQKKPLIRWF